MAALGAEQRDRAVARAVAAGEEDPESYEGHRRYLPGTAAIEADRFVGGTLALATALDLTWPLLVEHKITSPFGNRMHPTLGEKKISGGRSRRPQWHRGHRSPARHRRGGRRVRGQRPLRDHQSRVRRPGTSYCRLQRHPGPPGRGDRRGETFALSGNTGRSTVPTSTTASGSPDGGSTRSGSDGDGRQRPPRLSRNPRAAGDSVRRGGVVDGDVPELGPAPGEAVDRDRQSLGVEGRARRHRGRGDARRRTRPVGAGPGHRGVDGRLAPVEPAPGAVPRRPHPDRHRAVAGNPDHQLGRRAGAGVRGPRSPPPVRARPPLAVPLRRPPVLRRGQGRDPSPVR